MHRDDVEIADSFARLLTLRKLQNIFFEFQGFESFSNNLDLLLQLL